MYNMSIALLANPSIKALYGLGSGSDSQTLSFAPTASSSPLTISGGNTVNIDNPQTLTVSGNTLSIARGNAVILPTGSGSPSLWSQFPALQTVSFSGYDAVLIGNIQAENALIIDPPADGAFKYRVTDASAPMPCSALFLERDRLASAGNPVGENLVLESHYYKENPVPPYTGNQDFCFRIVHQGANTWLRTAWETPSGGIVPAVPNPPPIYTMGSITLDGSPVIVNTDQGANGFNIRSTASGWNSLYSDANGSLFQVSTADTGSSWSPGFLIPKTQCGTYTASGNTGNVLVPFPIHFTNSSYIVCATSADLLNIPNVSATFSDATQFNLAWTNGGGGTHDINWIAVGT